MGVKIGSMEREEAGKWEGEWGNGEGSGQEAAAPHRSAAAAAIPRPAPPSGPPRAAAGRGRASGVEGGRWRRSCCAWCPLSAGTWSRNEGQDGGCWDGTGSSPGSW